MLSKYFLASALLASAALYAGSSSAAVVSVCFGSATCSTGTEQDIFLQSGAGTTGAGNVGSQNGAPLVSFTSADSLKLANGFATIKSSVPNGTFSNLTFSTPGYTFLDLVFGAQLDKGADFSISDGTTTQTFVAANNGNTTYQVVSTTPLSQLFLSSNAGINQLKQFQVSGLTLAGSGGGVGGVPEPTTWAMMLMGFAGLGIAGYRAQRKSSLPA